MEDTSSMTENSLNLTPISHATFVMTLLDQTIYNDPVGGVEAFSGQNEPDIILLSDIHGDHLEVDTLTTVSKENTKIIVPQAVADELPDGLSGEIIIMANGETIDVNGISVEAIPMYNVPESDEAPHTKGRGNGYLLSASGKRIYIAGDTGPTDEMKALQNIDVAFIPMNLPYTMSVDDAALAVRAFSPKVVHPYHYRGPDGLSDINKFKELVEDDNSNITVELLNFYPEQ